MPHDRPHRRPPPKTKPAAPTHWGPAAKWYDALVGEEGSEYQQEVVFPGVLKLLGPQPGQNILDVACGQGAFARQLHQRGIHVTGVDAARELIDLARQRSDPAIRYHVADARELSQLKLPPADAAVCILAIQNIDPLAPVFAGVAHHLKPAARFVIAMMHPSFRSPKATAWGWDEVGKVQYRRVDRYLLPRKEPIVTHPGKDPTRYTWTFHRPLQSYVNALARAGLLVDAVEEWTSHKVSNSGPRAGAENTARKEIPLFMAIRAVKTNPPLPSR